MQVRTGELFLHSISWPKLVLDPYLTSVYRFKRARKAPSSGNWVLLVLWPLTPTPSSLINTKYIFYNKPSSPMKWEICIVFPISIRASLVWPIRTERSLITVLTWVNNCESDYLQVIICMHWITRLEVENIDRCSLGYTCYWASVASCRWRAPCINCWPF